MKTSISFATISIAACAFALFLGVGCGRSVQIELTPKFTRSTHPVDAKDAHILSPENYDKISDGMTQDEVRAVFGTAQPIVTGNKPDEEYELVWEHAGKEIAVRFRGDKSTRKSQKGVMAEVP